MFTSFFRLLPVFALITFNAQAWASPERARDLGIPFSGTPGINNAITDVANIKVGHTTLIADTSQGPVRTGVTVLSAGDPSEPTGVRAGFFSFNGTGEMTGSHFVREYGAFFGPLALTGTASVGTVRDALHTWAERFAPDIAFSRSLPIVGETYDGALNSGTVKAKDVWSAISRLSSGPVAEGGVGGGTGMISFDFKAGIGTSSRRIDIDGQTYTVGVLVQSNFGSRKHLTIAGLPVGEVMKETLLPIRVQAPKGVQDGSIVVIIATDAPLESRQLERIAKRGVLGLARTGSIGENLSGDLFLAFSTANRVDLGSSSIQTLKTLQDSSLDPLFAGTVQATEEAIINATVAGQKMTGLKGTVFGIPHDELRDLIARATEWRKLPNPQ